MSLMVSNWEIDLTLNILVELLGVFFTIFIIERLINWRHKKSIKPILRYVNKRIVVTYLELLKEIGNISSNTLLSKEEIVEIIKSIDLLNSRLEKYVDLYLPYLSEDLQVGITDTMDEIPELKKWLESEAMDIIRSRTEKLKEIKSKIHATKQRIARGSIRIANKINSHVLMEVANQFLVEN